MHNRKSTDIGRLFSAEPLHTFEIRRVLLTAASAVVFLCALFIPMYPIFTKALFTFSFLLSAAYTAAGLAGSIKRGSILCTELLVLISSVLCFITAGFGDAACVSLFYSVSALIQSAALACEQSGAWSPVGAVPDRARVSAEEGIYNIKASKLKAGDVCIVENGCMVPADGTVVEGMSELEINCFSTEPTVRTVVRGSRAPGGSINNGETLLIETDRDYSDSFIQRVFGSFSKAAASETSVEKRLSRFFGWFAVGVLALTVLLCLIVPLFKGEWAKRAFTAASLLLVCCPFCIKGSLSIAGFRAVERIFGAGAIIKNAGVVDGLATVSELVCNKTGTVTESEYTVTDIQTQGINEKNFLILVSRIECCSDHPIARAVRSYCGTEKQNEPPENFSATEIEGRGIVADIGGNSFMLGNATLLSENGISCLIPDKNGTAVHLSVNGNYCGYILLENRTRQSAYDTVETLRALGVKKLTMLSCDLRSIARPIAASLNFDSIKSELNREEKLRAIRYIMENKNPRTGVVYVGNGADEMETASESDISVATGMLFSSDVPADADVWLLTPGIDALPGIIKTAGQCRKVSRINLIAAVVSRIVLLVLTLCGLTGPVAVAVILALVSAFACFNTIYLFGKY